MSVSTRDLRIIERRCFKAGRYDDARLIVQAITEIEALRAAQVGVNVGVARDLAWEAIVRADHVIDRLEAVRAGRVVRDLDEATVAYNLARAKAAVGVNVGVNAPASAPAA